MLRILRNEPSAVLLTVQLAGVLLYPFMEGSGGGSALFSVFGILVLGLVVLAVRATPALTWVGVLLGLPSTVLLLIVAVTGDETLIPYSSAFEAVLYFYAAGALIAYMLADHEITRDELFAVGATSRWWHGASPTSMSCGRRSSRTASSPRSTRRASGHGWSCCS